MDNIRRMDDTKLLWHMGRVIQHFDDNKRVAPIHIDMGIAKFCNIACNFCYGLFQCYDKTFIQKNALLQTIRDAKDIGVKSIAFIGDGEPTCNPYMYDAVNLAGEIELDLAISTNGVLVDTEDKCKAILSSCRWMRYCLSAGTKEGYSLIHGRDYFDRVVRNIGLMVEIKNKYGYKCDIGLQAVYVPGIMDNEMIEEAKLAVKLGVDYFVIKQCSLPVRNQIVGSVSFDVEDYSCDKVVNILKEAESHSTAKTSIIPKWNTIMRKGKREYKHCPAVALISEISGNGNWFPCGYFFSDKSEYEHYKFGNIHEKSLKEIFESERYWSIIEYFREMFDSHNDCVGSCRLDPCNRFIDGYLHKPSGINFI